MPLPRYILAAGLALGPWLLAPPPAAPCVGQTPAWIGRGPGDFGRGVAPAGDLDGDGLADWLVAAPEPTGLDGRVYVYRGARDGLSEAPALARPGELAPVVAPKVEGARLAAPAGDVDGDGRPDLVHVRTQGAQDAVFVGTAEGPARRVRLTGFEGVTAVSTAGDVDGDGFADVLVTGIGLGQRARVAVYRGSADGVQAHAAWTMTGIGRRAAPVGDVNGDGADDLLLGLYGDGLGFRPGAALFLGIPAR